jgi:O-antigen/teichoic acid export membrane protein
MGKIAARVPGLAGGRRAGITVADQAVSSSSNFAISAVVAHASGPAGLGAFSIAYAAWQLVAGMHRALITDPMAIEGDARGAEASAGVRSGFGAELMLGLLGTVCLGTVGLAVFLAGSRSFSYALLALAPWVPALLVQDYWRWVGFMTRRPGRSLANDIVFDCVQAGAFAAVLVSHDNSIWLLVGSWGLGAVAGMLFGMVQNRCLPSLPGGLRLLRQRWAIGRWIAGSSMMSSASSQGYAVVVAALLGPAALGGLNAARNLVSGPAGVLIQAGGSVGLPEASRAYTERGVGGLFSVARRVTAAGLASFALVVGIVVIWGRPLLSLLYGPRFGHFWGIAVLMGVAYLVSTVILGPILILKTLRQTRALMIVQAALLVVSLVSTAALCVPFGVTGVAEASLISCTSAAVLYSYLSRKARAGTAANSTEGAVPPLAPALPTGPSSEPLSHPIRTL